MFYFKFFLLLAGVIALLNGCTKEIYDSGEYIDSKQILSASSAYMRLVAKPFRYYLTGDDLTVESLKKAISSSLQYYYKIDPDTEFCFGRMTYTSTDMIDSLHLFQQIIDSKNEYEAMIKKLESNFYLFESTANLEEPGVLFTGYYEPIFEGSLTKTDEYTVPVYTIPEDLLVLYLGEFRDSLKDRTIVYRVEDNTVLPYYTRREIMEEGVLNGKESVIAWMKDPVDLFFMQIQGSGVLKLPDGELIKLSYRGSNGHRYSSIGKLLVDEGIMALEDVSMQSLRKYLKDHPESRDRILYHNKSYTFFEIERTVEGPRGNIGVPLTPHRSIAVDSNIFPKGALSYVVSEIPVFKNSWQDKETERIARFTLIQDTGGAIKGPGRADLFWGSGILSEKSAGKMRSFGKLYFLAAKPEALAAFRVEPP